MRVAVLSIGDELMFGEVVDTNFSRIASALYGAGIPVGRHLTVGDDEQAITDGLRMLAADHQAVVATGGLGPTSDDRTAAAAARAGGVPLELNRDALAHVRRVAGRFGGDLPPANEKQALIPSGSPLIANPGGTACGFVLTLNGCRCYFLPGVPKEMNRMFAESVLPALVSEAGAMSCRTATVTVFGLSEAELETLLAQIVPPASGLELAFCVRFPEVQVKLRGTGEGAQVIDRLEAAIGRVREILGAHIVAEGEETIESVVAGLLREKNLTLSLAESCTGGLIAKWMTDLPGSSVYFLEGAVTYSNASKTRQLQVSPSLLDERGAVSAEVAQAMAEGIRGASGSDMALAVTGIAGPDGGSAEKPVGTVYIALADGAGCTAAGYSFRGDRDEIRQLTAYTALDLLRRKLR